MKKFYPVAAILVCAVLSFTTAKAQLNFSLSINIGNQPTWGPVGYDHVDYYYLPDIDCYYDVPHQQFVYLNGNSWVRATALPARYGNYNLYTGYKVVVNQPTPYLHSAVYRTKYASYKGRRGQSLIRDSRDPKYTKYHGNNGGRPRPQPQPQRPPAKPSRPVVKPGRPGGPGKPDEHGKPGNPGRPGDNGKPGDNGRPGDRH